MTTGDRIKEARKYRNLTQKELAKKLGISYQALAQWENDLRKPKPETLERIGDALKIDWTYFTDWKVRPGTVRAADGSYAEMERDPVETLVSLSRITGIAEDEILTQTAEERKAMYQIVGNRLEEMEANLNKLKLALEVGLLYQSFTEKDFFTVKSLVLMFLTKLNDTGQQEALKRIQELTEIPRYQRAKAGEDPDA